MKDFYDLPIYFIIIGLAITIILSLYAKVSFIALLIRCIAIIILFGIIGYMTAGVLESARLNIRSNRKRKSEVEEEVTTSSTIDIRTEAEDEDELLRAMAQKEEAGEDFVEVKPDDFKNFMNSD